MLSLRDVRDIAAPLVERSFSCRPLNEVVNTSKSPGLSVGLFQVLSPSGTDEDASPAVSPKPSGPDMPPASSSFLYPSHNPLINPAGVMYMSQYMNPFLQVRANGFKSLPGMLNFKLQRFPFVGQTES